MSDSRSAGIDGDVVGGGSGGGNGSVDGIDSGGNASGGGNSGGNGFALLELDGITKSFGGVEVLRGISLSVRPGEFITLLGASGCGKTTTIRIIAGFEQPDSGRVSIEGRDVTAVEPNRRNVNTVFQNYALFPHMNVEKNIAYSLKIRGRPKTEIRAAVAGALEAVRLEGFEKRMPHELSGGQRQRVAIARAMVNSPKALLLDEPLGALDTQLRRQMQVELKRIQKKLNIAFIYITHDQEEALNMSDRIAVMRDGVFEQVGTAADIYDRPDTDYVARFVGNANVLAGFMPDGSRARSGAVAAEAETLAVVAETSAAATSATETSAAALSAAVMSAATTAVAVRSENVVFSPVGQAKQTGQVGRATQAGQAEQAVQAGHSYPDGFKGDISAVITDKTFTGGMLRLTAKLDGGGKIVASRHGLDSDLAIGQRVAVSWAPGSAATVRVTDE